MNIVFHLNIIQIILGSFFFFFFCRERVPFLVSCDKVILPTWKFEVYEWNFPRWMTVLVIAKHHFLSQPETEFA